MAVACGGTHAAAVTEDGGLWAWGWLSVRWDSLEQRPLPSFVGGLEKFATRFVMLAAGASHSAALASDGTAPGGVDLGSCH